MVAHLDRIERSDTGQTASRPKSVKRSHSEDDRHQFRHALKDQMKDQLEEELNRDKDRTDSDEVILGNDRKNEENTKETGDEVILQGVQSDDSSKKEKPKMTSATDHIDVKA